MTKDEIKAKVLEQFPNAYLATSYDMYQIMGTNHTPIITSSELEAWHDFYEKYCINQPTNMKQLARQDFENLPVSTIIKLGDGTEYKFNHVEKELVFLINKSGTCTAYSIDFIMQIEATINQPKQYYKGWEVRSYELDNVWVYTSDTSTDSAISEKHLLLLKEVTNSGFIDSDLNNWNYAIQITDINTNKMCDESKIHDK